MDEQATLFDSFNARLIEAEHVGKSFVYTSNFNGVAAPQHTAILGPRGSGKTTLLKMITLPAISRWNHPSKDAIASRINYLSAYIPASVTWRTDFRAFSSQELDPIISRILSISLFRHSVLSSIVDAFVSTGMKFVKDDNILKKFYLEPAFEVVSPIVHEIARAWGIEISSLTPQGLAAAIHQRVRLLQRLTVMASLKPINADDMLDKHKFLADHYIDDAISFMNIVEGYFKWPIKLALCFDELEIAADAIAGSVLRAPRSIDQRVLIKFSAAPYVAAAPFIKGPSAPAQQNDFSLTYLSSFSTNDVGEFSDGLFRSLAAARGVEANPLSVLGASFFEDDIAHRNIGRYAYTGTRQRKFQSLFDKDSTFSDYVMQKGFDIKNLDRGGENSRAADIRKIIWPVVVREEFLFEQERQKNTPRRRLRSKKPVADIYTGAGAIFALCEGNPRWIIGLLGPLIDNYKETGSSVQRSTQKAAIERMIAAYFALLSTIPISGKIEGPSCLVDLIDMLGVFFQASVLGEKFNPDPILSFEVDPKVPSSVRDLVGRGLNIGAFVSSTRLASGQSYHVGEIEGLKVRLSNILAPHYKLPLAGGRTVGLSTILSRTQKPRQSALFDLFGGPQ